MFDNDQLIARFGAVSDAINKTLEESPKISERGRCPSALRG